MNYFICSICTKEINIELKTKRSGKKCIECFKEKENERHQKYREKNKEKLKIYVNDNKDKKKEYAKIYRENNKEKINESKRNTYKKIQELPEDETNEINKKWQEFILNRNEYKNNDILINRKKWIMESYEYTNCECCNKRIQNSNKYIHKKFCKPV
jgi:hypothetical protein